MGWNGTLSASNGSGKGKAKQGGAAARRPSSQPKLLLSAAGAGRQAGAGNRKDETVVVGWSLLREATGKFFQRPNFYTS